MPATFTNNIVIKTKGFKQAMAGLEEIPQEAKQALEDAIKETLGFLREEIPRIVHQRYDISMSSLMDQSHRTGKWKMIPKVTEKGGYIVDGGMEVIGTRIPTMRFNVNPTYVPVQRGIPVRARQVVTVTVRRGKAHVGQPNTFIARMKSGHIGVFHRKEDAKHRIRPDGQRTALNITEDYRISVPEMLQGKQLQRQLRNNTTKFFNRKCEEEVERVIKNLKQSPPTEETP